MRDIIPIGKDKTIAVEPFTFWDCVEKPNAKKSNDERGLDMIAYTD